MQYVLCLLILAGSIGAFSHTLHASPLQTTGEDSMSPATPPRMPALNPEERRVIKDKGTEPPFSGAYWNAHDAGVYVCRQCGQALYTSDAKFDSGCGWPSFDAMLPGAVLRKPDADGSRTEILCASCGGHLGHVFEGERLTPKNTRHCVNSLSLSFVPAERIASAVFAGGCFWGIEDAFSTVPGVLDAVSGYTGGKTENPTYQEVGSGLTGHAEAVRVWYDSARVDYATLARLFFEIHDPTQENRQGPDIGTQYRSAVFYANPKQEAIARSLLQELRSLGWNVVTSVEPLGAFYPAEAYHQDFTRRTGRGSCHIRVPRFARQNSASSLQTQPLPEKKND